MNVQKFIKRYESSSDSDDNEQSAVQQVRSIMTLSNFPFSERRDQSDGDSVRFRNDANSDEEEIENENANSVEVSSSDEEEGNFKNVKLKMNDDEEDYFELQKIIEEDEQIKEQDEIQETPYKFNYLIIKINHLDFLKILLISQYSIKVIILLFIYNILLLLFLLNSFPLNSLIQQNLTS